MDYTVQEGDTLSEILYNITGDGSSEYYNQVAQANNISNSDMIYAGQVIHIDESKVSSAAASTTAETNATNSAGTNSANTHSISGNNSTIPESKKPKTSSSNSEFSQMAYEDSASKESTSTSSPTLQAQNKPGNSQFQEIAFAEETSSTKNETSQQASNSTVDTASPQIATATTTARGNYRFTSTIEDDDDIVMDIDAARQYIEGTMDGDLGQMCSCLKTLVSDLETMQGRQYSTTGTAVDEDYKDFEAITEALVNFLIECNMILDQIVNYINSCYLTLNN